MNGREKAIHPDIFSEGIVGVGATCRIQMPLRIAFALSIHKSQGMTLDQALIDVARCFAGGQTYVAISRVGPREGLRFAQALNWERIRTEPTFVNWDCLRTDMERRKRLVLELLEPAEREVVESLGLKSLHAHVTRALEEKDAAGQNVVKDPTLRIRMAALKNALGKLKPARIEPKGQQDSPMVIWQMLPWKIKRRRY